MTTIVGDWSKKILVADSQFSDDDTGIKYFEDKIYPIPNGWLGGAGHQSDIEKVVDYMNGKIKAKPKIKNDNSFLMLTDKGLFSTDNELDWETVRTFMAIGSGAMAAEVCMRMGLTAEEAIVWACNVDANSSGPVKTYSLDNAL